MSKIRIVSAYLAVLLWITVAVYYISNKEPTRYSVFCWDDKGLVFKDERAEIHQENGMLKIVRGNGETYYLHNVDCIIKEL